MTITQPIEAGRSRLAEAASSNLRVDCARQQAPEERLTSRMLQLRSDGLLLAVPTHDGRPAEIAPGEALICIFRLGPELLRFVSPVESFVSYRVKPEVHVPALRLTAPGTLEVIQRRQYYRVSLVGRAPVDVTVWPVEFDRQNRPQVAGEFHAPMADISAGGIGLLVTDEAFFEAIIGRQVWVRFRLPDETESLIFRMVYRHRRPLEEGRRYLVGLEYGAFIDPSAHAVVIDRLTHFVAQQQRESLNRRKDR